MATSKLSAAELRRRKLARQARWRNAHRAEIRDRQNEKNWRWGQRTKKNHIATAEETAEALALVGRAHLGRPPLLYLRGDGAVIQEDYRSAEELIGDFLRDQAAAKTDTFPADAAISQGVTNPRSTASRSQDAKKKGSQA